MRLLFLFALFYVAGFAQAQITDGNSLADGLRLFHKWTEEGPDKLDAIQVHTAVSTSSYVQGFLDGCGVWQLLSVNVPFKFPEEGMSAAQFEKVAEKYLNDHPEALHRRAGDLLYEALIKGFPNPDYIKRTPPSS
jgi:Rap1a immunity proteins